MNKRLITILAILILGLGFIMLYVKSQFNADFATHISLNYMYDSHSNNEVLSDKLVIEELKSLLKGQIYSDNPSCGFSTEISITLMDEDKTVILCPALDGCSIIRIGEANEYFKISDSNRQKLDKILNKYGFKFPSL